MRAAGIRRLGMPLAGLWIGVMAMHAGAVAEPAGTATEFPPEDVDSRGVPSDAWVVLESDPPGAEVRFADQMLATPDTISASPGRHEVHATLEGFEPLEAELDLAAADTVVARFVLLRHPPEPPTPEDLDLSYDPILPPLNLLEAERIESTYWSLIETFAIIPLSQGVMLKMASPDDSGVPGNEMILSGLGLIATTYLLGDYLHDRKVRQIEEGNAEITARNEAAKTHNASVQEAVDLRAAERLAAWESESRGRGRVVISRR